MLILQLDAVAVDAIVGALNLHAAICQQTGQQIQVQVTNQMQPSPAKNTEAPSDVPPDDPAQGPDGS